MNELIKLTQQTLNDTEVNTVNARELHEFLEVRTRFNDWIVKRIEDYDFKENQDFLIVTEKKVTMTSSGNKATNIKQYYISLSMAKELSMVERNDKGKEARKYFIECSNKADLILQTLSHLEYQPKTDLLYLRDSVYVTDSLIVSNMLNKHHYHVLRDIETEVKALEENPNLDARQKGMLLSGFVKDSYLTAQNKELPRYILSEEAALQVLLKYSSDIRARFILAFKEARETLNNIVKLKEISKVLPEIGLDTSYVYIIKNMDTGNIKVGVSKDVQKRLDTFRTGNDCQLELVYRSMVCSNAFNLESQVHEYFKEYHVRGEWFRVKEHEVIRFLECSNYLLKANSIDVTGKGILPAVEKEARGVENVLCSV